MQLPSLEEIRAAQRLVYGYLPPTPQYSWPLLNRRLGTEAWVKHENHTPVGAFKIRGALIYLDRLVRDRPSLNGAIAATRGNFGQGVAMAARLFGVRAVIVAPHGNSVEKNRAMVAQGAELLEHGKDFQDSLEFARTLAAEKGLALVESFHELLVLGTAGYALEFLEGAPALDAVYVPIGMGSSICGMAAARNALGVKTEIVGVVSAEAPATALSFRERKLVEAPARTLIADGLACRTPHPEALAAIWANVSQVVEVSDEEIKDAMRAFYEDTHNLAEGAGAAALAAAVQMKAKIAGRRIGIVLTGGNVDRQVYAEVLSQVPRR